jgi:hypothetical protein
MLGVGIALLVIGLIVLFLSPIIGLAVGGIGLALLILALVLRTRRAAADSGGP